MLEICFGSCRAAGALVQRRPKRGPSLLCLLGPPLRWAAVRHVRPAASRLIPMPALPARRSLDV